MLTQDRDVLFSLCKAKINLKNKFQYENTTLSFLENNVLISAATSVPDVSLLLCTARTVIRNTPLTHFIHFSYMMITRADFAAAAAAATVAASLPACSAASRRASLLLRAASDCRESRIRNTTLENGYRHQIGAVPSVIPSTACECSAPLNTTALPEGMHTVNFCV